MKKLKAIGSFSIDLSVKSNEERKSPPPNVWKKHPKGVWGSAILSFDL
ncbi:MAG: hypothetical protein Q8O99_01940 [bacterium]|nr:hypothetical protein [bacterium]